MPARTAPWSAPALTLLRTLPVKEAHLKLVEDFPDLRPSQLHQLKNRHKDELAKPAPRTDAGDLIPPEWCVHPRHEANSAALKLRLLSRRLHGMPLANNPDNIPKLERRLDDWLRWMVTTDRVVTYSRTHGFDTAPRRYWEPIPGWKRPLDEWIKDPKRNDDGTYR